DTGHNRGLHIALALWPACEEGSQPEGDQRRYDGHHDNDTGGAATRHAIADIPRREGQSDEYEDDNHGLDQPCSRFLSHSTLPREWGGQDARTWDRSRSSAVLAEISAQ